MLCYVRVFFLEPNALIGGCQGAKEFIEAQRVRGRGTVDELSWQAGRLASMYLSFHVLPCFVCVCACVCVSVRVCVPSRKYQTGVYLSV